MSAAIHDRTEPDAQLLVTAKQWCCLYDAANGKLVARARHAAEVWSTTGDGAILHPGAVIDALVAAAMLRQVRNGRWSLRASTCAAPGAQRQEASFRGLARVRLSGSR
jgi:hypothetical protein